MMRTELNLCVLSEKSLCKFLKRSFKVCKCDILVDNKTLYLMECRRMCGIHLIWTENSARCYHSYRKLSFLHLMYLNWRCLRTKKYILCNIECILFIFCRVVVRDIECLKIIVIILNLRSLNNFITHSNKYIFNFFKCYRIWMTVSHCEFFARKCDIYRLTLEFFI